MYELTAALITGAATLVAALLATQDGRLVLTKLFGLKAQAGAPNQRSSPVLRFLLVFVVGAVAGGFVFHLVQKASAINGYRTPAGTIVAYMGNIPPPGWLMCNGDPVGDDHRMLKGMLADGRTPDLRGMFLRGLDPTGKIDIDGRGSRALGSPQSDALKQHSHPVNGVLIPGYGSEHYDAGGKIVLSGNATAGDSPTGGTETRPKNVAVNFIIKY